MKLACAGTVLSRETTEADIRNAFADDDGRGAFVILSESEQVFIQAAGEGNGPYTLEYREGDDTRHYQCPRHVKKSAVESAFLKYLLRDASWKTDFEWESLNE